MPEVTAAFEGVEGGLAALGVRPFGVDGFEATLLRIAVAPVVGSLLALCSDAEERCSTTEGRLMVEGARALLMVKPFACAALWSPMSCCEAELPCRCHVVAHRGIEMRVLRR